MVAEQYPWLITLFVACLGALIGSFLNVVGIRLLKEESFVSPGSHCVNCQAPIKPYDNIPVLSWLLLKGQCRSCKQPIHWQYPLIEALTAIIFVMTYRAYGLSWETLLLWWLSANLMVVLITDFREQVIFDINSLGLIPVGLLFSWTHGTSGPWVNLLGTVPMPLGFELAVFAVVGAWLVFFILNMLSRLVLGADGFGAGDTRVLMAFGAFFGVLPMFWIFFLGFVIQAVIGIPMLLWQWYKAKAYETLKYTAFAFVLVAIPYALQWAIPKQPIGLMIAALVFGSVAMAFAIKALKAAKSLPSGLTYLPFGPALVLGCWLYIFMMKP